MKKVIIIVVSVFVFLLALLLLSPLLFKGSIVKMVEKQSANYINAELVIGDVSLSFFKDFPNLNVGLKDVVVIGKNEFAGDTLVKVPLFALSVNVKSLLFGDNMVVNKLLLRNASAYPTTNANGLNNWDVLIEDKKSSNTTNTNINTSNAKTEGSDVNLQLDDIEIENLNVEYSDYKASNYSSVGRMDMKLKGNFSEENTLVDVALALENISFRTGNSLLLNNCNLKWDSEIAANLKEMTFHINKNDLSLNDLKLNLTGGVKVIGEGKYNVDLQLNAPDTKFESLFALVPKDFQKYIEGMNATGDFNLSATAKGDYFEKNLPAIDAIFAVKNAKVKYEKLPESIDNINIDLSVTNPGGSVDSTVVNLKAMTFEIARNPFNMFAKVVNLNDPVISGGAKGVISFESLKNALPLENVTLKGMLTTDISFDGKYKYIEQEQYEKFTAKGTIVLKDILFINKDYPKGIAVESGTIVVTPAKLNLNNLKAKVYSSDFTLQGYLSNYLPYLFKNETIRGNFSLNSNLINLNEFMASVDTTAVKHSSAKPTTTAVATNAAALEIPKNMDLKLDTRVGTVLFDDLTIRNVKGNVHLAGGIASLTNLSMDMLQGEMIMSGKYNTTDPKTPTVNFNLNVSEFDLNSVYHSFSMVKKSLPIAMDCQGKISSRMNFLATLDKNMSPIMTTLNGEGSIDSKGIIINNNPTMDQLSSLIKNEELKRLSISKLKVDFKIKNGDITVEPFTTALAGNPLTIYGNQTVTGNLNYTMSLNVKREFFGSDVNKLLSAVPGSKNIQNLDIDVVIGGTLDKPVIKPDLTKAITKVAKEAEKELIDKAKGGILKGLGKLFQ